MVRIPLYDEISIHKQDAGIRFTCSDPTLPVDESNLVVRAAKAFYKASSLSTGVAIHLEKRIPMAAGLGGGSANAATTLLGLNRLMGQPLTAQALHQMASAIGSDVPFFLQQHPANVIGRGEIIQQLEPFPCLAGKGILLIHPGFGISTPWSYAQLSRFPSALNGSPGRTAKLVKFLQEGDFSLAMAQLYNALEAPAVEKFPILAIYQEYLRANGALGALMSGSGSATFALTADLASARNLERSFKTQFGEVWTAAVALS